MRIATAEADPFLPKVLDTDALLIEDCVLVRGGAEACGRDAVKLVLASLNRAIPDLEHRIDGAMSLH